MSLTVESIKTRISEYEAELVKVVSQHSSLMGGLNELKQLLELASSIAAAVAPEASPVVDAVTEGVEALDAALTPVDASAPQQ